MGMIQPGVGLEPASEQATPIYAAQLPYHHPIEWAERMTDTTDDRTCSRGGARLGGYRLQTGSDGESHIEEIKAEALRDIKVTGTMSFSVQQREPGSFLDFHPAPLRRWQVGLVGRTTIGRSDGPSHTFGPGDVRLIEDTTGKGHTTTSLEGLTITMQIAAREG